MALLGSVGLAVVGLIIGFTQGGTEIATVGWMFFGFGMVFLIGTLFLRSRGIRAPRRGEPYRRKP